MLRDITIGQYYRADSIIHKLDPRVKLVSTFVFLVSLFVVQKYIGYLIATAFLISCIIICKVPFKYMVKGMKAIFVLLIIAVVFNLFLTPGEKLWSYGRFAITREGIVMAAKMAVRLVYLILGSSIMTLTTTPNNLTDAIEAVLKPLKYIKVPVHEIAMMMSISLRFIPILLEETDRIMKAQMARGVDFEKGNVITKAKNLVPLLVPLFISAFRRANDLAMAMEARCYRGGEGRTRMKPLKYKMRDYLAYLIVLAYFALCILFR